MDKEHKEREHLKGAAAQSIDIDPDLVVHQCHRSQSIASSEQYDSVPTHGSPHFPPLSVLSVHSSKCLQCFISLVLLHCSPNNGNTGGSFSHHMSPLTGTPICSNLHRAVGLTLEITETASCLLLMKKSTLGAPPSHQSKLPRSPSWYHLNRLCSQ